MTIARVVFASSAAVVSMLAFVAWGLVPMYDLFCEWTGVTGRVDKKAETVSTQIDTDRTVKVQFVAQNQSNMPWQFAPAVHSIEIHPGANQQTSFFVANNTPNFVVAQAISSVSPFEASTHFHKIECFCFTQQALQAGEQKDMGLVFYLDTDLPSDITEITLSYTLFDITDKLTAAQLDALQQGEES